MSLCNLRGYLSNKVLHSYLPFELIFAERVHRAVQSDSYAGCQDLLSNTHVSVYAKRRASLLASSSIKWLAPPGPLDRSLMDGGSQLSRTDRPPRLKPSVTQVSSFHGTFNLKNQGQIENVRGKHSEAAYTRLWSEARLVSPSLVLG